MTEPDDTLALTNHLTVAINNPDPILIIRPDGLLVVPFDGGVTKTLSELTHSELRLLVLKLAECLSGRFHPTGLKDEP